MVLTVEASSRPAVRPAVRSRRRGATPPPPVTIAASSMPATERAVPAMRRFARHTALRWSVPRTTVDALELVVTELVSNAVLHSGSPDVTVLVTYRGRELTVEVKDSGRWRVRQTPRRVPEDAGAAFGRGLDLVAHATSGWLAFLSATGTTVVATLSVPSARA
ncbi:ATP-binding protein [Kitasatospora sp. NPDC089509]|uniref:ATP-binding protein n=1 Tax=Kitasatospora sp. NPDC089509 TaxID=3364079 RepID=UPI0037F5CC1B